MYVELWTASRPGIRLMAIIRSEGGKMVIDAKEPIPPRIQSDLDKQRARVKGDEPFLRSLTLEMSGGYMQATLVRE